MAKPSKRLKQHPFDRFYWQVRHTKLPRTSRTFRRIQRENHAHYERLWRTNGWPAHILVISPAARREARYT